MRRALLLALLAVPAWGQNVLVNPGFEGGLAGWTVYSSQAGGVTVDGQAHSGDASALMLAPTQLPSAAAIWQEVRVSKGGHYCVSAWLQPWTDGAGFGLLVDSREERLVELLAYGAPGAWGWQRACFVVPRWRVRVTISAAKGIQAGGGYVDDVRLEPVAY